MIHHHSCILADKLLISVASSHSPRPTSRSKKEVDGVVDDAEVSKDDGIGFSGQEWDWERKGLSDSDSTPVISSNTNSKGAGEDS
jgi:hypothetical protein